MNAGYHRPCNYLNFRQGKSLKAHKPKVKMTRNLLERTKIGLISLISNLFPFNTMAFDISAFKRLFLKAHVHELEREKEKSMHFIP